MGLLYQGVINVLKIFRASSKRLTLCVCINLIAESEKQTVGDDFYRREYQPVVSHIIFNLIQVFLFEIDQRVDGYGLDFRNIPLRSCLFTDL